MQKLFKDNHLNITIQCSLKIVNYLEVTFLIFLMLPTDLFARLATNPHIHIRNQTTHHLF